MFTGLVEEAGRVVGVESISGGCRFYVKGEVVSDGTKVGDSIANNGCCLTVVSIGEDGALGFDLLKETQSRTNLRNLSEGSLINLERALPVGGRMGGHFVSGHVDGLGKVLRWEESEGGDYVLEVQAPEGCGRYLVSKGCIAVDGISLTVADVRNDVFSVWIIPHTKEATALREKLVGDLVNLEFDLLAKYVEKLSAIN